MTPPASRRTLRIAHRGASARAPENTLAAFEEAIRLGVDAIELDVHLCADGVPVVIHDATVDRTTDGRGEVARLALAQLRVLDAGGWFAPRFRGERIPTLAEALECARGRCGIVLEIKDPPRRGGRGLKRRPRAPAAFRALAEEVAAVLARARFQDLLVVSSFSSAALVAARAALPRVRLGLLASRTLRGTTALHRRAGLWAVHPHLRLATRRRILRAHRLGLAVLVWPVNDRRRMEILAAGGADGLMTDDPALFRGLDLPEARALS